MWSWIWCSFLSISVVNGADVLRIPLIQTSTPGRRNFGKRAAGVGVAQLVDDVVPGSPNLDLGYLGAVSIGTPPQEFLLHIDSGSGILWVADQDCRGCNVSAARLFNPSASTSIKSIGQEIDILYGKGSVACNGYNDTVSFGGITMTSFTFGSCFGELDMFFPESVGLLGVGFPDPQFGRTNSWIIEAFQRGLIPAPVYSLTLGRFDSNALTEGSLMVIGGYDEEQVSGAINWIHTSGTIHVQIPMDGVIVNGATFVRQDGLPMQAIIDSGTGGVIIGPNNVVRAVYDILGGVESPDQPGYYEFPCNPTPSIGFQLGGQNYMIDFADFIVAQSGNTCLGVLVGDDSPDDTGTQPVFILSALFMKNVVTVFDLGTPAVGFGRLKSTNEQFGEYTIVPDNQRTALGTGPSALLSPTIKRPVPTGPTLTLQEYAIALTQGTGRVNDNTAAVPKQTGLPNPGTVAVIPNLAGTTIPATQANTVLISIPPPVTDLILGTFVLGGGPGQPTDTLGFAGGGTTSKTASGTTSGTSPFGSTSSHRNFALLGVIGVALIFFMM